jgi:hypothetical protein
MTMSDEAYGQMLAYESTNRSINYAKRETVDFVVNMFITHLHREHNLGYRQIGKRLGLKWTYVKTIIMREDNGQSKR